MAGTTARLTRDTVRPRLMLVNSLVPVNAETPDTSEETPGTRLRDYIDARWNRRNGGILGLAKRLNASTETMYAWFRGDQEPSLDHLTRLADALGVQRWEILAAMDGAAPVVPLDALTEAMMRRVAERVLDERLGPQRGPDAT